MFSGRIYIYADDLVITADSLEECLRRLLIWKESVDEKGRKYMSGLDFLQCSG